MANNVQLNFVTHIKSSISALGLFYNETELSGSNYSRLSINPDTQLTITSDDTNYYIKNTVELSWPQAQSDWGTFNQVGVFSGTTLWFLVDVSSRTVRQYDQVFIAENYLQITIPKAIT